MPPRSLDNAVIAVVGASGGLGAPISHLLHSRGANVVLAGRDPGRLSAVGLPSDALSVVLDLRDRSAGTALVDAVRDRHGRLDGLVNAAGAVAFGSLVDTDDGVLEELFVANVLGPLWLLKRAVPMLAESKGFVLHLSAVVAEQPMAGMAAYSASKAALTGADMALTRELRRSGIQLVDARPPHTETGLAGRPLSGIAPSLPPGLDPDWVAARLVAAIEAGETVMPSDAFALTP
jgi:NAD(P)-dependent dehydrogenase (short-subunit alcohol dehydrogenase family)